MTPERLHTLRQALLRRQPDLTVLLDGVHKAHNLSAVVRSCDATGVFEVNAVSESGQVPGHHLTSGGSWKWVSVRVHRDIDAAFDALERAGFVTVAADLSPDATDFRDFDYTRPTAVVLGAELEGLSERSRERVSACVRIPMSGLVESLNVSVAAALILFEAQRQRAAAGLYDESRLPAEIFGKTLFEWCWPEIAEHCRRKGVPYPPLDEEGDLAGPIPSPEPAAPA